MFIYRVLRFLILISIIYWFIGFYKRVYSKWVVWVGVRGFSYE